MQFVEILTGMVPTESVAVILPGVVIALMLGAALGRIGRRKLAQERDSLHQWVTQQKRSSSARVEPGPGNLAPVANLALTLPHVVRSLNRDDLSPSDVPPLILDMAKAIFDPEQVLLYGIRSVGNNRVLSLMASRGVDELPEDLNTITAGTGKIGWVAVHELDMLSTDWSTLARTERISVPDNHPLLKSDIMGPLVQHTKNRRKVLGVLSIGKSRIRPTDPKLMFQMVTNLGSLALVSASNLKKMRLAAHHDGLTGLLNKRCFLGDVTTKLLMECEKAAKSLSIFIFDIDHFKTYNDTNGHPAGDELLRSLGAMIKKSLRPGYLACRYGGEEFVIAMPDTDAETAYEFADSLRATIEAEPFPHRKKQPSGKVSISGGVAASPKDGTTMAELIQRADEALYGSKKSGRNRVACYKGVTIGDSSDPSYAIDLSRAAQTETGDSAQR